MDTSTRPRRRRAALAGLPLIMAALAAACTPIPGRTALVADSNGALARQWAPILQPADGQATTADGTATGGGTYVFDTAGKVGAGLDFTQSSQRARLKADVDNPDRSPQYVIIAAGPNEASWTTGARDGWKVPKDPNAGLLLATTPDASACVVMVKPWLAAGNTLDSDIGAYRAWVDQLVAAGPGIGREIVAVDWQPLVEADPALLGGDGVHLSGAGAAVAYVDLMVAGLDACGSGS